MSNEANRPDEILKNEDAAGAELIDKTNEKINRAMGAQPGEYVHSTGLFTNASPGKRIAMEEFSAAKDSGFEAGYPSYMAEIKQYKPWAKLLRIISLAAFVVFCVCAVFAILFETGEMSESAVKRISDAVVSLWYLFILLPVALYILATVFGQKRK